MDIGRRVGNFFKHLMVPKAAQQQEDAQRKARDWQIFRRRILQRDQYRCRACGERGLVDVHHLRPRSIGGKDTTKNCAALCRACHSYLHVGRLTMTGDADGELVPHWASPREAAR